MRLIGNYLNGDYFENIAQLADSSMLQYISLAVAYVQSMDRIFEIARSRNVPVTLYALADGGAFPSTQVMRKFLEGPAAWQLFLTRRFYHPKILWFRGVGVYIGSANLTQAGWWDNLECGVWLSQDEIVRENIDAQLLSMFEVIASRSVPARKEHLATYERLAARHHQLNEAERRFKEQADQELASIEGQDKPIRPNKPRGGAAKHRFIIEWQNGLTVLRKITELITERKWPSWVSKETPPSIVQDQATEYWYGRELRRSGESLARVKELHFQNKSNPQLALDTLLAEWAVFEGSEQWIFFVNEAPRRVRDLLVREEIADLHEATLAEVLQNTHASREHARQMKKQDLGDKGQETPTEERCRLFAKYLLAQRSEGGKDVRQVLSYVLWGDAITPDVAERIWDAAHEIEWKIPHLGPNILGELVGYARPNEFPPRNGRVSKTLAALGFEGISF
jgi:PLD-like domain